MISPMNTGQRRKIPITVAEMYRAKKKKMAKYCLNEE
jgi:hypothetical protein